MTFGVAAAGRFLTDCKRLLWRSSSDGSFEYANNFVSLARCGGLEFSYCHFMLDVAVEVDGLAVGEGDEGLFVGICFAALEAALGPAGLVLGITKE